MCCCAMAKLAINAEEMYCTTGLIPACQVFTWECKDSLGSFSDDISEVISLKAQPAKNLKQYLNSSQEHILMIDLLVNKMQDLKDQASFKEKSSFSDQCLTTNAELHEYLAVAGAKMRLSQLKGYDTRRTFISGQ